MKYTLQYYNRIQETDSEERKKELMAKGYQLVKVDGKLVTAENKQKDLETAHEELMKAYEALQKNYADVLQKNKQLEAGQQDMEGLKRRIAELEAEKDTAVKQKAETEKTGKTK